MDTPRAPRTLDATAAALVAATRAPTVLVARWEALRDAAAAQLFAAIGRGDLGAARRLRDALQDAQPFLDRVLPPSGAPQAEAALALAALLHLAHVGADALEAPAAEQTLARPGDTARAVMGVLRGAEAALTRGDVHARLPSASRPTKARISQVLDELVRLGFATRLRIAQGERVTGHYALSEAGQGLCRQLDIAATEGAQARMARVRGSVTYKGEVYDPQRMLALVPDEVPWAMTG
jgi:hypothetical protein